MKKNYQEHEENLEVIVEEQKETIDMLAELLKEEVHEILNCGLANKAIMGFYTMAMLQTGFSKEDTRKSWDALEVILEDYESEDAEGIYDLLMGSNEPLRNYIEESLEKKEAFAG